MFDVKGVTPRFAHIPMKKLSLNFQVRRWEFLLIFSILNHPNVPL